MSSMLTKKILIVGGGPVGLSAALFLQKQGLKPRIIERSTDFTIYSKALAINPRSLDIMSRVGLTEHLLKEGMKARRLSMFYNDKPVIQQRLDEVQIPGNKYPFMLVLAQSRTEAIERELLKERGIEVETGTELKDIKQEKGKVQVKIAKNGQKKEEEFDLVYAADGAKSTVRKKLNIPFTGSTFKPLMYLSDFEIPPIRDEDVHVQARFWKDKTLAMIPVNRTHVRLISNYPDYRKLVPESVYKLGKEVWQSSFHVNHRVCDRFHQGNVFLGGDAAHIHSPVGGRGMNIGFEDTYVFSQLLKKGELHKYTPLRKPVLDKMVGKIDNLTDFFLNAEHSYIRPMMPYLLPVMRTFMKKNLLTFVQGLDHEIGV